MNLFLHYIINVHKPSQVKINYVQNLEGSTVANTLRYSSNQTVVSHITAKYEGTVISQKSRELTELRKLHGLPIAYITYKYHNPVSWHISGESDPTKLLPRSPLQVGKQTSKLEFVNMKPFSITLSSRHKPFTYRYCKTSFQ